MDNKSLIQNVNLATKHLHKLYNDYGNKLSKEMIALFDEYSRLHKKLQDMGVLSKEIVLWLPKPVGIRTSSVPYKMNAATKFVVSKKVARKRAPPDITPRSDRDFKKMNLEAKRMRRFVEDMIPLTEEMLKVMNRCVYPSDNDSLSSRRHGAREEEDYSSDDDDDDDDEEEED